MALRSFFDIATDSSVKAVVGCGCSTATEVVAKVSHYFNTPVVSQTLKRYVNSSVQKLPCIYTDLLCQHISGPQ